MTLDSDRLLKTLQELIRIESINPTLVEGGSGENEIAQFIGDKLDSLDIEVNYQEIEPGRNNVIGIINGTGHGRSLMLNGHLDTVSVEGMEIEPFIPRFDDGRVYGRGSFDMKSGLTGMLATAEYIVETGIQLDGDLILAFVADEEYGSLGTERLLQDYTADGGIICEPTSLDVITAHRGYAWIHVDVHGRQAHGSQYDVGIDAITKAGKVLAAIEQLERKFEDAPRYPLLERSSVHASLITGGIELSTYPDHCRIDIERRTLPNETEEDIVLEFENILSSIKTTDEDFNATSDVFFYRPGFEVRSDAEIIEIIQDARRKVLGVEKSPVGAAWWTDAALMVNAGIETVLFGPTGDGAHAAVEWVDFNSVVDCTRVLVEVAKSFCGSM